MNRTIRRVWGAPFAVLSVAAFGLGALFHHQAVDAAASEAARKELGSCCHPAEETSAQSATESKTRENRSKIALAAGVLLLGAAVVPAALAGDESGRQAG